MRSERFVAACQLAFVGRTKRTLGALGHPVSLVAVLVRLRGFCDQVAPLLRRTFTCGFEFLLRAAWLRAVYRARLIVAHSHYRRWRFYQPLAIYRPVPENLMLAASGQR